MNNNSDYPMNESYMEILLAWKGYVNARGFNINTQKSHVHCIKEFLSHMDKKCLYTLKEIKPVDIWKHYEYLQTRPNKRRDGGLSASMLNFHVYSLRTFFGWLQNLEAININPFSGLEFPRQFSKPRKAISKEEIKEMYNKAESNKDRALLSVFYALGLRRAEGADLKLSDIEFGLNKVIVRSGKFGKRRELPMHPKAAQMLRDYIQTERREIIVLRVPKDRQALFYNSMGNPMRGDKMNLRITELAQKANIKSPVTLHVLRHSVATHLKENGMPIEQISDFLGHSSLDVTQNYLHGYGWKWNQKQRNKNWKDERV